MSEMKHCLKQFFDIFKSKNQKLIGALIKEMLIYSLMLCFFKIPFTLCSNIVVDYFYKISNENILGQIFYWLFEILYILFIILLIKYWLLKKFGTVNK